MIKRKTKHPTPTHTPPTHAGQALAEPGLRRLLAQVAAGQLPVDDALETLKMLGSEELEFASVDHHRGLRKDFPEVIYCAGKTPSQVAAIAGKLAVHGRVLGTRATKQHFNAARKTVPGLQYHQLARAIWWEGNVPPKTHGIAIVAAGTSDLAVAEEAALTAELMGNHVQRVYDVGVAGLHRLIRHLPQLRQANVVVVVAGMEGALPSVLGGLVAAPIIAVPTSVGYGTSFGGVAALLGMLNSCASGVAVVNIDNGFGAGYMAAAINRRCTHNH